MAVETARSLRPLLFGPGAYLATQEGPPAASQGSAGLWSVLDAMPAGARALRLGRPEPTMAFGRLDTFRAGYPRARARSLEHGFTPTVREVGGHAAAYDAGCLVLDLAGREDRPRQATMARFEEFADLLADSLRLLGVDARVGEVPDEYCPGRFSVNARGATKLVGTAQRVTTRGWLLSAVITVRDQGGVRDVVQDVYAHLQLPLDPATVGSVSGEVGKITVSDVERAVRATLRPRDQTRPG